MRGRKDPTEMNKIRWGKKIEESNNAIEMNNIRWAKNIEVYLALYL